MKTVRVLVTSIFLLCVMSAGVYAADEGKIGYVDLSRLFDEYHKTKEYDKVLESKHGELEKIGKEKIEKIRESEGRLALLKEDKRKMLEGEIDLMIEVNDISHLEQVIDLLKRTPGVIQVEKG